MTTPVAEMGDSSLPLTVQSIFTIDLRAKVLIAWKSGVGSGAGGGGGGGGTKGFLVILVEVATFFSCFFSGFLIGVVEAVVVAKLFFSVVVAIGVVLRFTISVLFSCRKNLFELNTHRATKKTKVNNKIFFEDIIINGL